MLVKSIWKVLVSSIAVFVLTSMMATAAPIFSDNFDDDALSLNQTVFWGGWTVSSGSVDVIGDPSFFDLLPENGRYIDLDGSTGQSGQFTNVVSLLAGQNYELTFDLAGSQRGSNETVYVQFGDTYADYTLNSGDGFSNYSLSFTPTVTDTYFLSFQNVGGDNVGALLDNTSVSAVPEPETYAMLLIGLLAVSVYSSKRNK